MFLERCKLQEELFVYTVHFRSILCLQKVFAFTEVGLNLVRIHCAQFSVCLGNVEGAMERKEL